MNGNFHVSYVYIQEKIHGNFRVPYDYYKETDREIFVYLMTTYKERDMEISEFLTLSIKDLIHLLKTPHNTTDPDQIPRRSKNLRPISLLNTDYKIANKAIAERWKKYYPQSFIHAKLDT